MPARLFEIGLDLEALGLAARVYATMAARGVTELRATPRGAASIAGRSHVDAGLRALRRLAERSCGLIELEAAGASVVIRCGFGTKSRRNPATSLGSSPEVPRRDPGRSDFAPKSGAKCAESLAPIPGSNGASCLLSERVSTRQEDKRTRGASALPRIGEPERPLGVRPVEPAELAALRARFAELGVELAPTRTVRALVAALPWSEVAHAVDVANAARVDGRARDFARYFVGVLRGRVAELGAASEIARAGGIPARWAAR